MARRKAKKGSGMKKGRKTAREKSRPGKKTKASRRPAPAPPAPGPVQSVESPAPAGPQETAGPAWFWEPASKEPSDPPE